MPVRTCPSCHHRLSAFALECPVCGLTLAKAPMPRPLLFQASALRGKSEQDPQHQAISVPALGRVTPVMLEPAEPELPDAELAWNALPAVPAAGRPALALPDPADSFWPLAKLEFAETLILAGLNLALVLFTWLQTGALAASYAGLWHFLAPMHFVLSWTLVMIPLVLTGRSPLMTRFGLQLDTLQPERRLAFSLFHLLSLCVFPLSFASMVLTPNHRTLAELLTGQDIVMRS